MIIRSYLVTLWALLFVSCGPTVAESVAVFDFELIDTSLEGAIRGARRDEQERLARLSDQLRQLLRDTRRFSLVDITPIASETGWFTIGFSRLAMASSERRQHPVLLERKDGTLVAWYCWFLRTSHGRGA